MAAALFHECFTTLFSAIVPNRLRNVGAKGAQPIGAASNLVLARQRTWLWLFVLAPLREICN